ncbi:MAG: hypothetical protein HXS54_10155 [Theionarchaea archaeon]|nr:hypothetical protein [Theionarchaea archaeon]
MILKGAELTFLGELINPSDIVWFLATVLVAFYLYLCARKEKRPCYVIRGVRNIPQKYYGIDMNGLTITKVLFWNDGRDTIRFEDIARADRLRFAIEANGKILDAIIVQVRTEANQFQVNVSKDKSNAIVNFDYIDKNEGAVFQLLHTGESFRNIKFMGRIKGGGIPCRKVIFPERLWERIVKEQINKKKLSATSFSFKDFNMFMAIPSLLIWFVVGIMILSTIFVGFSFWGGPLSFFTELTIYVLLGFLFRGRKHPRGYDIYEKDL